MSLLKVLFRFSTEDLYKAIKPHYMTSRTLGILTYSIEPVTKRPSRCKKWMEALWNLIQMIGLLIASIFFTIGISIDKKRLLAYLHKVQMSLIYCHLGIAVVTTMRNRKRIRRIYRSLKRIDTVLANLGMRFEYDTTSQILETVFVVILLAAGNLLYINTINIYRSVLTLIFSIHAFMSHQSRKHMTIVLAVLRSHFRFIGDRLATTGESSPYAGRIWKLETLVELHEWLCTLGDSTNSIFAMQSLSGVGAIFCILTGNTYLFVYALVYNQKHPIDRRLFDVVFWNIYWAHELWQLVHLSKTTTDESKRFTDILYRLIAEDNTKEISTNEVMSLHLVMARSVEFTAYDFFPLDYTLLHSIAASTTTYLIILIQFTN